MKKIFTILVVVLLTANVFAQAPGRMSYQAVIRDASDNLVTNQAIGIQISILQGSITGTAVYVETQAPTTNVNGLATIEIGGGTLISGNFTTIDWAGGPYFIKTETDPTGGTAYTITGTSQLLSVPYALYAETANYNSLTNLPTLFDGSWNSLSGTPTSISGYGITDAMSTSHAANGITDAGSGLVITTTERANWSTAFSWGDHTSVGYFANGGESSGTNRTLGNNDSYDLGFLTNGANRLHIRHDGNVGIGTTSPLYPLSIFRSSTPCFIQAKSNTGYAGLVIDKGDPDDNGYVLYRQGGDDKWFAGLIDDNNFSISTTHATPDGKFFIDTNGMVGIGTTSPQRSLEVKGDWQTARLSTTLSGPFLEFEGSSSTDYGIGVWSNVLRITSTTDTFNTVNDEFIFSTTYFRPFAGNNKSLGTSAQYWTNLYSKDGNFTGEVNIEGYIKGYDSPLGGLQVHDDNNELASLYITPMTSVSGDSAMIFLAEDNAAYYGVYWLYNGSGNHLELWGKSGSTHYGPHMTIERDDGDMAINSRVGIGISSPGSLTYQLEVNGSAAKPGGGSWSNASDRRLKQNVSAFSDGLDKILSINPVKYRYNEKSGFNTKKEYVGVIAQELKKVAPYMVGSFEKDDVQYLDVDNSAMTYMLINAVKELKAENDLLKAEIKEIKARLK